MDISSELQSRYTNMCQTFEGGLSNTSTKKFDPIIQLFSENFNLPVEDIYAVGSGSRPGNIEVRLSQGTRATQHTKLGLTFIVNDKGTPENTAKLTNSAFVTIEKFLGRGKSSYENVLVIVDSKGTITVSGLVHSNKSIISKRLIDALSIPMVKEVEVKHNPNNSSPTDILLPSEILVPRVKENFIKFWDIIDQHGANKADYINKFENAINPYLPKLDLGYTHVFQILDIEQYEMIVELLIKKFPELSYFSKSRNNNGTKYQAISTQEHYRNFLRIIALSDFRGNLNIQKDKRLYVAVQSSETDNSYLRAMRTKPFLLLAGISGTGKSRIVKQMAFDSCPDKWGLRNDTTSPGNYCLIEVKPNWHDSTELLGYESHINGLRYNLTPFVKFLAKAMLHEDVPFFVCLDEMNLAPVEQYFAEFLSVLESRTKIDGHIVSEPLIKNSIFANAEYETELKHELFDVKIKAKDENGLKIYEADLSENENQVYETLKKHGLRIPENVIVIGTVNMDETTHQFSRKVIDRAMTIEMNLPDGDPFMDFFNKGSELVYRSVPTSPSLYLATETKASDVIKALSEDNAEKTDWLKKEVASFLNNLNEKLDSTPFKVAYRVQNELMLYFYQLWLEDKSAKWRDILNTACDQILMMKVLPRIEGDEELLEEPLKRLATFFEPFVNAHKKIKDMSDRLDQSRFTSFWP